MNFLESVALAWDALLQNKLRTALTVLGIIIGVAAVIAVIAIGRGTQTAVVSELAGFGADTISVFPAAAMEGRELQRVRLLDDEDVRMLQDLLPGIRQVVKVNFRQGMVRGPEGSLSMRMLGISANGAEVLNLRPGEGRFFSAEEESAAARVAVLGHNKAEDLFPSGAVGRTLYIDGWPYLVVGVLEESQGFLASAVGAGGDDDIYLPVSVIARDSGQAVYPQVILQVAPGHRVENVRRDAGDVLKALYPDAQYSAFSIDQAIEAVQSVTNILTAVVSAIAGIALAVGGVGIMNIMLVSVTERTREIGIRKALGARRRDLMRQFLVEAVVICLVGGLIGLVLAAVPVWLVGRLVGIPLLISWESVVLAVGFSAGIGLLFGVYPASKAAALDPIQALRRE